MEIETQIRRVEGSEDEYFIIKHARAPRAREAGRGWQVLLFHGHLSGPEQMIERFLPLIDESRGGQPGISLWSYKVPLARITASCMNGKSHPLPILREILAPALFDFLRTAQEDSKDAAIIGHSLGAALAIWIALDNPRFKKLFLISAPYDDHRFKIIDRLVSVLNPDDIIGTPLISLLYPARRVPPRNLIASLNVDRIYLIHGDADLRIPYSQMALLRAALMLPPDQCLTLPGGGHTLLDWRAIAAFVRDALIYRREKTGFEDLYG